METLKPFASVFTAKAIEVEGGSKAEGVNWYLTNFRWVKSSRASAENALYQTLSSM